MEDRWDVQKVFCIKAYKTLKLTSGYSIKGRGNLTHNADPEVGGKKGHGYGIEDDMFGYDPDNVNWWKLPHNKRVKMYYFTESEMSEYFITDSENYKIYLRDQKINSVIND